MKEILIGIAITVGGAVVLAVLAGLVKFYQMISELARSVKTLLGINDIQSDNIIVIKKSWLEMIKALRSHSYALREVGANGSVTRALEHIGKAEDIMNKCDDANAEAAMKASEKAS